MSTSVILPPAPSWFPLDLVTSVHPQPPSVPLTIAPPDPLVVTVTTPVDAQVVATFVDAQGTYWSVGVEQVSPTEVSVVVPTLGMPTGRSVLSVQVMDTGLTTTYQFSVYVDRPKAYDVTASTSGAYDVESGVGGTLILQTDVIPVYEVKGQTSG